MSIGCCISGKHNCIQISEENIEDLLQKFSLSILDWQDALVLTLTLPLSFTKLSKLVQNSSCKKLIILIEPNIQVSLIDDLDFNFVLILAKENAKIEIKKQKPWSVSYWLCSSKGSSINLSLAFCKLNAVDFGIMNIYAIIQRNAEVNFKSRYFLKNNQKLELNILQQHSGTNSKSDFDLKAALTDSANLICSSKILIDKNAINSKAFQNNQIILSPSLKKLFVKPKIKLKPCFEALTNDVSCSHGCSISPLDHSQLFYLRTRGLKIARAEQMLLKALMK